MMTHRGLIFFFFVIISSEADQLKKLKASVGGNITLPDAVEEEGFLSYQRKILAIVNDKKLQKIFDKDFKDRLHWDQNTGYFTLTQLQKNFSGIYAVDSKKTKEFLEQYNLSVYDSVPTPQVTVLNRSSESCSLSCSVDSPQDDVTLLWLKDEKILEKSRSASSLSLTLSYQQDQNVSLQCVAENPVGNKTVSIHVRTFCDRNRHLNTNSSKNDRHHWIIIIAPVSVCLVFVLVCAYIIRRFRHQKKLTVEQKEDVVYTDVKVICPNRHKYNISPPKCESREMNTVYDQVAICPTDY